MKVFTHNNFKGHYPVGTAAVIVAKDRGQARKLLGEDLKHRGLEQELKLNDFNELKLDDPRAVVLMDGNY